MLHLGTRAVLRIVLGGLAAGLFLAASTPARADLVTYSTSGGFTAGTDASVSGGGTILSITDPSDASRVVTVTWTPQASTTVNTPVVANLGTFTVDASSITGKALDIPTSPIASTFQVNINQTGPTAGSGSFLATIGGSVSFNGGFVEVRFATPTSTTIGPVTYTLVNLTNNLPPFPNNSFLLSPLAAGGATKLSAFVTAVPTPEPSSIALTASGMVGLLFYAWRRRRSLA
jgi:hypothetical protein